MTIIDEIKDRVDIVDLVAETGSVKLRRSGKNHTGFCPFHANRKTPALVVFPDTGTWHCFGSCNEGGTVIDWVLKQNPGWDVKEAIRHLAQKANIPMGELDGPELKQRLATRAREDALTIAARLFAKWLMDDPEALAYALGRGWDGETIAAARLGFSGRATAAQMDEMRGEFALHGIDPESPDAVMILGYKGDVKAWAKKHGLDPASFKPDKVHGLMDTPGLVYAHKLGGRIVYLSRRQLPGFDRGGEWKSFNPYSALAGDKVPFFNHMHLRERDRIVIVEGQADAITLAMWGIPAMALCGSAWKNLDSYIELLKEKYETIYFATDADTPGEKIVIGAGRDEGKFPLTAAFGPMLWVCRWPKFEWGEKSSKDANDLAQYFRDNEIEEKVRDDTLSNIFDEALPIVVLAAEWAGQQKAADREKCLDVVTPLILQMPPRTRDDMRIRLANALYPPGSTNGTPLQQYNKLIGEEQKRAEKGGDGVIVPEHTMGGWFREDDNSGWLVELYYDLEAEKTKFAYAHILDMKNDVREIGTADFLDIKGSRYAPLNDGNFDYPHPTVYLPTGLGPLKTTRELLANIEFFIRRYFLLDEASRYKLLAAYALFTWVYDSFDACNFLFARGGSGSGKSDLMYLVGVVSYRLMVTLAVSSVAGYKGLAHLYKGTLFIDEAQDLMKEDRGEMRALLKGRATVRFASVINMMEVMSPTGKMYVPSSSKVYGPTVMTGYGDFDDDGINNRCVPLDLSQKDTLELEQVGIEPGYYPPELAQEADELRNWLLHWRLKTWRPKIELTPEERKKYKLADPLVSPRVNQVMRPMKVLAVKQGDMDLLDDLKLIGRATYEDEMIKRSGSFEAAIMRAVIAVTEKEGYQEYLNEGKFGKLGAIQFVLFKDLAQVANELMDAENYRDDADEDDKRKKSSIKPRTVGNICRETFRMQVHKTNQGMAVILDKNKIEIGKLRFGLDRQDEIILMEHSKNGKKAQAGLFEDPSTSPGGSAQDGGEK